MARGLKFQILKIEGLYYLCSENKGADQLRGTFVFAYAINRFSHDWAHLALSKKNGHQGFYSHALKRSGYTGIALSSRHSVVMSCYNS